MPPPAGRVGGGETVWFSCSLSAAHSAGWFGVYSPAPFSAPSAGECSEQPH